MNKSFFYFLLMLVSLFSCNKKDDQFTIRANLLDITEGTVFYLKNTDSDNIIDSACVENGNLLLKGKINRPESLLLYATDSLRKEFIYTFLFIGNEHVEFRASAKDFPWNIDVSGSQSQDIAEQFNRVEFQRQQLTTQLRNRYTENKVILSEKLIQLSDSLDNIKVSLIKSNVNSCVALNNLVKYYKDRFSRDDLIELYSKLTPELQDSKYGRAIKIQIDFPAPKIGDNYYDYTALDQKEKSFSLSQISDKFILLHFSSSACFPSMESIPEQRRHYEKYSDKLEIVKISEDISKERWHKSIEKDSIPWINMWDGNGPFSDAVLKYGVIGTPNFVLISPERKVLETWFGYEEGIIQNKLEKYLNGEPDILQEQVR